MSYQTAKDCFAENCNLVGRNPMRDPLVWNLNNGLTQLTHAVEMDLGNMQNLLSQILHELQRRR